VGSTSSFVSDPISQRHITDSRALAELAKPPRQKPGVRRHFTTTYIRRPLPEIFGFFSDARNLEALTPPQLEFNILTEGDIPMRDGALIDYRLKLHGVPFTWRTRILCWDPPFGFVDDQVSGPYSIWHHIHSFTDEGDRVRMDDEVLYRLPLWPLGEVAAPFVRRRVEEIFAYRTKKIREIFGEE
jgi:ligand-binding SRPBCC domain-containing protein